MEFLNVVRYEEAIEKIFRHMPQTKIEKVSLINAYGRVLAQEIFCPEDQPPFDRTTVDGYAVKAEDTFGSSESIPAFLTMVGEVVMGKETNHTLEGNQCMWIPTGGMLPQGANGAVMVEYTEKLDDTTILINRPISPGENIMFKGEDIRKDTLIGSPGKLLLPQDIGMLAALGINEVEVYVPLKIGIISTGDEIIDINEEPLIGQIRDVNTYALASAVKACGLTPKTYPIVKDDFNALKQAVKLALDENDILIMSGGSSVGIADETLNVLMDFPQAQLLFHGLAVKPGKPTMGVNIADKLVIGLPGHPVSALMMFYIILRPVITKLNIATTQAVLDSNLASQAGRDDFIPVELNLLGNQKIATPLLGKSGLMSILVKADGYIKISHEKQGLLKGEEVEVFLF